MIFASRQVVGLHLQHDVPVLLDDHPRQPGASLLDLKRDLEITLAEGALAARHGSPPVGQARPPPKRMWRAGTYADLPNIAQQPANRRRARKRLQSLDYVC